MKRALSQIALPEEGLALMRRLLGLLCLLDACDRLPSASFLLSDIGVLPRILYFTLHDSDWNWSLYLISGDAVFVHGLLLVTALLGALQLLGLSSPISRVVLWALIASVQVRNPAVNYTEDFILRALLFWDMLLGERYEPGEKIDLCHPAVLGLQLQLTIIFASLIWHFSPANWALMVQWDGSTHPVAPWWPWLERAALSLCLAAVWWPRVRRPVLYVALLFYAVRGLWLSPHLPVVILASLAVLYSPVKGVREKRVESSNARFLAACLFAGYLAALSLNLPYLAQPGRLLALEQTWNNPIPSAEPRIVELAARRESGTVWSVTSDSDRRYRALADTIASNKLWAHNLRRALSVGTTKSNTEIWLRQRELRPDFSTQETVTELIDEGSVE